MLDWKRLLTTYGIPFADAGKFNITTGCPFCGATDINKHYLAISTRGRGWRCFRNPHQHRGKSNTRLVMSLLRCDETRARELAGEEHEVLPDKDEFPSQWRKQLGLVDPNSGKPTRLELPREFKSMFTPGRFADPFWNYLESRGFTEGQALWAVKRYEMMYAITGNYAWRVILPVRGVNKKLMTWTGRSIKKEAPVRYLSLATDEALAAPGDLLLGLPLLWDPQYKARCLVVCEGPFDAIAVSVLGYAAGIWGTCLFGVNVSPAQADLLWQLETRFERKRLLIDPDARLRVLALREQLPRSFETTMLTPGLKDPGELLRFKQGREFVHALAA